MKEIEILEEMYFESQNYWAFLVKDFGYVKIFNWGNVKPHIDVIRYYLMKRGFFA